MKVQKCKTKAADLGTGYNRVHTDLEFFFPEFSLSFEGEKYNIFPESAVNFLLFSMSKSYIPILQDR